MLERFVTATAVVLISGAALAGQPVRQSATAHVMVIDGHDVENCCLTYAELAPVNRERVESSVARAGLGGDSTVRANNDNRSTIGIFYIYQAD